MPRCEHLQRLWAHTWPAHFPPPLPCRAIVGGGGGTTELAMCARLVKCVCCANKYECGLIELKWRVARAARGASASAFAFASTSAFALPPYCLHFYTHVRPSVKPRSKQDWPYLSLPLPAATARLMSAQIFAQNRLAN